MRIRILITGGTIDGLVEPGHEGGYSETFIPEMLEQAKCQASIVPEVLMMKDSTDIRTQEREIMLNAIIKCNESKIVITHGTNTMVETAQFLKEANIGKTIVLCGAMKPFKSEGSDAMFNLGAATLSVQLLQPGVYIVMHGKVFDPSKTQKDFEQMIFEEK